MIGHEGLKFRVRTLRFKMQELGIRVWCPGGEGEGLGSRV